MRGSADYHQRQIFAGYKRNLREKCLEKMQAAVWFAYTSGQNSNYKRGFSRL
jgi:hypothetical protein